MPKEKSESATGERVTADRVQAALDEHRALLWQLREKTDRHLRLIDRELAKLDEISMSFSTEQRPRRIIDRIVTFLAERNRATEETEILEAMMKIGAAYGRRDSLKQIRDSISANLPPRHRIPKLKRIGELIGLAEWPEDKFR